MPKSRKNRLSNAEAKRLDDLELLAMLKEAEAALKARDTIPHEKVKELIRQKYSGSKSIKP